MPIWSSAKCRVASRRMAPLFEHPQHAALRAAPAQLAAEEDVGGDVERRRDGEVLVDGLDPGAPRVAWRAEVHALAVEADLPLVRLQCSRERLDQCRLAGAVVADDREDLARVELEVGPVQRDDVSVALDDPARLEDRRDGVLTPLSGA